MSKTKRWVALTAVLSIGVVLAGYFLLISPRRHKVKEAQAAATTAEQQNDALRTHLSVLQAQSQQVASQRAELAAAAGKIPTTPDLPGLLRQLASTATTTGVDLTTLTPSQPSALAAVPSVSSISVNLTVTGNYFEIEQYVNALETLNRAMLVTGVNLAPGGSSNSAASQGTAASATDGDTLTANLTTMVFTGTVGA